MGRVIQFKVLYNIPTGTKRDYGTVTLQGGEKFPDSGVSEGWLKVREDAGRREETAESKELLEMLELSQAKAKAESKGLWGGTGGQPETAYELPEPQDFVDQNKGKIMDAIVEKVISGDRIIVRLLVSPSRHVQTLALIAGIRAPLTKRTDSPAEPFGTEAQHFVEERLMQRNIKIKVIGVSPQRVLICDVRHPLKGSIAAVVLEAGLARCTDHHSTLLGGDMSTLRQAEKKARQGRLGVWQEHVDSNAALGTDTEAVVSRVQTADTVFVRNKSGDEKRSSLSSIRQPKPTDPKQAPFQAEAKEFLRKKLIGKHVRVKVDGKKAASEGFEEREVVTLTLNNKNIALALVEAGYASVIRHRKDDNDRSPSYDELLAAEVTAQSEQKGMWSPKPPTTKTYVDYSESLQKAKIQASVLQRQKKIPAVVDFVKSGSRFTVLIPRENAKLTLVLSGIRAPRSARNENEKSEPFGLEAHEFAVRRCMQRDVEIDVETTDKVGGFIGALYVNRESFAKLLLEEGFASVHAYSAEQSGNANELFAAEKHAQEAHRGMWHDYDPTADGEQDTEPAMQDLSIDDHAGMNGIATNNTTPKKDYRDVIVTHIEPSTCRLKVQIIGQGTATLSTLASSFNKYHSQPVNSAPLSSLPKAGDLCSAKFSEDGQWYRARIRRNDREAKKADVVFIDYGNSETLPWSTLRPLPSQFNTNFLKPQAVDAAFSFLQFPTSAEYLADAASFLAETTLNKSVVANVNFEDKKENTLWLTLFDPEQGTKGEDNSINAEIIEEGLAMIARKLRPWEASSNKLIESMKRKETEAKEKRRGTWEYGDLTED